MHTPERSKSSLAKYGLTEEQFRRMYLDQKGLCAICPKRMIGRDCHVDHDHVTGKVRGLICSSCNTGLGFFKDSVRLLASAIVYLEKHGKDFDDPTHTAAEQRIALSVDCPTCHAGANILCYTGSGIVTNNLHVARTLLALTREATSTYRLI